MKLPSKTPKQKKIRTVLILATLLVAILALLEVTNVTSFFHKSKTPATTTFSDTKTANQQTKGESQTNPTTSNKQDQQPGNDKFSDFTGTLLEPSGNFVSNHHPNISGQPAPNQIQSGCVTTPGADCQITFTSSGGTKTLPLQKTDKGGATYWTWNLQDIGLTEGTWKVQAKATLGSQVKTSDDAIDLVVSP